MRIFVCSLLVPFLVACAHRAEAPTPEPEPKAASAHAPGPSGAKPTDAEKSLSGKVAEAFDAAGYTYLRVALADGREVWAAAPQQVIEVGSQVVLETSIKMQNFVSKALGRTFEEIYFVTVSSVEPAPPAASDMI